MLRALTLSLLACAMLVSSAVGQNPREQKVLADRKKVEADGFWIYNDLSKGFAEAKKTGKPMLVGLRCIPCEECVKLDDELVDKHERVRPLLEKFVRVRVISTNGLDLSLFQFDYDQSFAVFFLNADGTIYGRYGTRSDRKSWSNDVSIDGLAKALQGALDLHLQYPMNAPVLAGKKGPAPEVPSPEKYPLLKDRYGPKLSTTDKVVQSCIHCHQIGDAQRQVIRDKKAPLPESVLFPYPHPKAIGLILDPKERATVLEIEKDSPAAKAGLQKGDRIMTMEEQPLLSIADVQWVLHHASADGATLKVKIERDGSTQTIPLELPKGWRRRDDISWRSSTWGYRRMATGGLVLESITSEERPQTGLPEIGMALRVKHVGQYGPHAAAHQAGFRKDDIVISFDGKTDFEREADLLAYALTAHKPGQRVPVVVMRDGKKIDLTLPMQP